MNLPAPGGRALDAAATADALDAAAEIAARAEERIELAFDAGAVAGSWFWDVIEDRFTADTRFARYFSLDPGSLRIGVPLAEVVQAIHPDDEAMVQQLIGQALSVGGPYRAQYRIRQGDGSYRWIEANGKVTLDAQGRALSFPGVLIDIGPRIQSEQHQRALLELGDALRGLENPSDIVATAARICGEALGAQRAGYGVIDLVGQNVDITRDWCRDADTFSIAGHHRFADFGSFIDNLRVGEVVAIADVSHDPRTAASDRQLWDLRIKALLNLPLMKDGRLAGVFLVHQSVPRPWSAEEVAFVHGVADRTWAAIATADALQELREVNTTLARELQRRTEDRNRLWQMSNDVMMIARFHGEIVDVNPAWERVLGWTDEELIESVFFDLIHPDDREQALAAAGAIAYGTWVPAFDSRCLHKDGSYRWISWSASQGDGLIVAAGRDISEMRAQSESLHQAEELLRQSQKMEAVGQLTGGIAHDFNNLLAGLGTSLQLLQARIANGQTEGAERYIQLGQESVRRAAALTHRLLAFSRRQTLDPRPLDLNRLVAGMEELLRRTVGPTVQMQVMAEDGLWPTRIDASQLENSLLNLCINARDAMQPEGGRLTIATANHVIDDGAAKEADLAPGPYISLCVTDTGSGMSPDVISHAFEPFFTTKPLGQGTGLGLSMVYGFARQSGGQLRIHSEVGRGTTLCMYLPRHAGEADTAQASAAAHAIQQGVGETVMLIEDDATIRMLLTEVLEEAGYHVLVAEDGPQGLRVLDAADRIDLLITDVGLPGGLNGRQVADAARVKRPALKVLFITGYAANAVVGNGHLAPGMEVITKPFDVAALANKVRWMIESGG